MQMADGNFLALKLVTLCWGARRILESQKLPNSRNKNQQIEEPLSESSRNYFRLGSVRFG